MGGCIELDVVSLFSVEDGGGFVAAAIDDNRRDVELVRHDAICITGGKQAEQFERTEI